MGENSRFVLIVDDSSQEALMLERYLTRASSGFTTMVVSSGAKALAACQEKIPDCVLLDSSLPDMDRGVFLNQLAALAPLETLAIVCLVPDEKASSFALKGQPISVLRKSMITPEKLLDATLSAIEQASLRRERRKSEAMFDLMCSHTRESIAITDSSGTLIAASKGYLSLHNLPDELIGKHLYSKLPLTEFRIAAERYQEVFHQMPAGSKMDSLVIDPDGTERIVETTINFYDERAKRLFMLSTSRDVSWEKRPHDMARVRERRKTPRREDEKKLSDTLKRKENHLAEVQAAARNCLKIVFSVMQFQANHISDRNPDKGLSKPLADAAKRVHFVMMAQEMLDYGHFHLRVRFEDYVKAILRYHDHSILKPRHVSITHNLQESRLPVYDAMLCALILNELVENSLLHAFPKESGRIFVELLHHVRIGKNQIVLTISDDGVGLPPKLDIKNSDSVGLMIISNLAKKLGAKVEVKRQKGTVFRLVFDESVSEPSPFLLNK
jgi:PAS domain S-box-containing protein